MDYDEGNRNNPERTIRQATKLCINPLSPALQNNFKPSAWAAEWKFTNNCYAMFIITLKCRYTFIKNDSDPLFWSLYSSGKMDTSIFSSRQLVWRLEVFCKLGLTFSLFHVSFDVTWFMFLNMILQVCVVRIFSLVTWCLCEYLHCFPGNFWYC